MMTKKVYIEPTIIVAALIQQGHLLTPSKGAKSLNENDYNMSWNKDGFGDDELDR